jgi:hypothetical protein
MRLAVLAVLALSTAFTACVPADNADSELSETEAIELINAAAPSDLELPAVAETLIFNSKATSVQREALRSSLLGKAVRWEFAVQDVAAMEGNRFQVTSQSIPVSDADAIGLVIVNALITSRGEADNSLLTKVQTGDVIRVRGIVQEIHVRSLIVLSPAVIDGTPQ